MQVDSTWARSHGRALNRYGRAVSAPTGQIWTVLPEKYDENGSSGKVLTSVWLPRSDEVDQLVAGDLVGEARAAVAEDAALAVEQHVIADRDRLLEVALGLDVAALAGAVAERLVLERALTALVADRAVERMVGEQQLEHPFLDALDGRRLGVDLHVGRDREHARRHQRRTASAVDLDEALTAHPDRLHPRVVAEAWDVDAGALGGSDDQLALARRERHAVDGRSRPRSDQPEGPRSRCGDVSHGTSGGCSDRLGVGPCVGPSVGPCVWRGPSAAMTGIVVRIGRLVTRAAKSSGNSVIAEWMGT